MVEETLVEDVGILVNGSQEHLHLHQVHDHPILREHVSHEVHEHLECLHEEVNNVLSLRC